MVESFCVLFFGLLLLALGCFLLKKDARGVLVQADNVFIVFYCGLFGVTFPLDYFYSIDGKFSNNYLMLISNFSLYEILVYYLCAISFLLAFIFSFRAINKAGSDANADVKGGKNTSLDNDRAFRVSVALLLIGLFADFLYIRAYGSYKTYLEYSGFLRSGVVLINNRWSFMIAFRGCVVLSSFCQFGLLKKRGRYSLFRVPLFAFSVLYSLLILYSNKGRLGLVLFLLMFPFLLIAQKHRRIYIGMKMVLFAFLLLVIFSLLIVYSGLILSRSQNTDPLYAVVGETAFVFGNFKAIISNKDAYSFRFFLDVLAYPVFLLPSSIWRKFFPITVSDICTIITSGSLKGENGNYGESPCDIISFGYLQFGYVGVLVTGIVLGFLVGLLFKRVKGIKSMRLRSTFSIYLVVYLLCQSVLYGDPYNVVHRLFPGVILFALITISKGFSPVSDYHQRKKTTVRGCFSVRTKNRGDLRE